MRMLFLAAGWVLLAAAGTVQAQERSSNARETRELPTPPKVKSKRTVPPVEAAPAVQKDSTPKPAAPRKAKSATTAPAREQEKLPRLEKPAKPRT